MNESQRDDGSRSNTQLVELIPVSREVTAKSLILDLVKTTDPGALPVSLLVNAGAIFGISENAIRVNVTRLSSRRQIETDARGYYRVGSETTTTRTWISGWMNGEKRVKPWKGDWLIISPSSSLAAKELRVLDAVCFRLGFRYCWKKIWIRPNNLSTPIPELMEKIAAFGGSQDFALSLASECYNPADGSRIQQGTQNNLWDIESMEMQYLALVEALETGIALYETTSVSDSFKKSYLLGGSVISALVSDPLLPAEFVDVKLRIRLTSLMKKYDECHRPAWNQFFQANTFENPPRNLALGIG